MCVSDIAEILKISQPATTNHLKILEGVGVLDRERIKGKVFFAVNIEVIQEYKDLIDMCHVKGFKPCPHNYNCDDCPIAEECE